MSFNFAPRDRKSKTSNVPIDGDMYNKAMALSLPQVQHVMDICALEFGSMDILGFIESLEWDGLDVGKFRGSIFSIADWDLTFPLFVTLVLLRGSNWTKQNRIFSDEKTKNIARLVVKKLGITMRTNRASGKLALTQDTVTVNRLISLLADFVVPTLYVIYNELRKKLNYGGTDQALLEAGVDAGLKIRQIFPDHGTNLPHWYRIAGIGGIIPEDYIADYRIWSFEHTKVITRNIKFAEGKNPTLETSNQAVDRPFNMMFYSKEARNEIKNYLALSISSKQEENDRATQMRTTSANTTDKVYLASMKTDTTKLATRMANFATTSGATISTAAGDFDNLKDDTAGDKDYVSKGEKKAAKQKK